MKLRRWITPAILFLLFLGYSYFAFPVSQSRAAAGPEDGRIAAVGREKNTWVALLQTDAGGWEAVTVQKSLLFNRFRVLDRYELDKPSFVSECNTPLVSYSYIIQDGEVAIYDPGPSPMLLLSWLLLLLLAWCLTGNLLDCALARRKREEKRDVG